MKKNKIMSIGLFAILSLSFIPMLFQNQNVYAQTFPPEKITGLGGDILEVHYQETTGILWALNGSRSVENSAFLLEISPINNTVLNTYNVTSNLNGGAPWDLWCGTGSTDTGFGSYCFVTSREQAGNTPNDSTGSIFRFETEGANKGTVSAQYNATTDDMGFGLIYGRDSTSGGIGGITLMVESYVTDVVVVDRIILLGGLTTELQVTNRFDNFNGNASADFLGDLVWTGVGGSDDNYVIAYQIRTTLASINIRIENLSTLSNFCNFDHTITGSGGGGGQIILDMDNQVVYIPAGTDGHYDAIDISSDACTVTNNAITDDDTGLSGSVTQKNGIAVPERALMFFQESGASARISTSGYDFDTESFTNNTAVTETIPNTSQTKDYGRAYYAVNHDENGQPTTGASIGSGSTAYNGIFIPMNEDEAIFIFKFEAPGEPSDVTGLDCELPANQNILICRLTQETGGNIGGLGGIIDTGLFSLFTNSGIIDGDDTDPKTNGVGYFITIVGFGVMTAMFFIATKGRLNEVPTFIWMLSAIALLGAITAIGWLDPTFLIIGIIVIIALSAMQVRNSIDRGLDFGGRGDF